MSKWKGPMGQAQQNTQTKSESWKGPMQPADTYKKSGSYTRRSGTSKRKKQKTSQKEPTWSGPMQQAQQKQQPPPKQQWTKGPMAQQNLSNTATQKTLSKTQLQQQLRQQEQQQLQQTIQSIDPTATYQVGGFTRGPMQQARTGKEIKGFTLISQYEQQQKQLRKKTYDLDRYPEGTKFKKTDTGEYKVILPKETKLRYSKQVLQETKDLPPGVKQIQQFRFGVESSFNALIAPVSNIFGKKATTGVVKGTQFVTTGLAGIGLDVVTGRDTSRTYMETTKKYGGQHFVSPFDVGFEPLGWSPKGSTKLLTSSPAFAAGGVFGEIGQGYAISGVVRAGSKYVVKPGTRAVTRTGIKAARKFTQVFPDEKLISKSIRKIGQTPFGKNLSNWATRGYQPVTRLTSAGAVKSTESTLKSQGATTRVINRKLIEGGGKRLERVFVSPKEAARASKQLSKRLGTRVDIAFPKKDVATTYMKTTKIKGVFGKRLVTTEKAFYTTLDEPFKTSSKQFLDKGLMFGVKKQPGFIRKAGDPSVFKNIDEAGDVSSYVTRLKPYEGRFKLDDVIDVNKQITRNIDDVYDVGYGGFQYDKIDDIGTLTQKKLVQPSRITPGTRSTKKSLSVQSWASADVTYDDVMKGWARTQTKAEQQAISRYRWRNPLKTLRKNTQATQSLISKPDISFAKPSLKTSNMGRLGLIRQLQAPKIPARMPVVPFNIVGLIGTHTISTRTRSLQPKTILINQQQYDKPEKIQYPQNISIQEPKLKPVTAVIPVSRQKQTQKQIQQTLLKQDQLMRQLMIPITGGGMPSPQQPIPQPKGKIPVIPFYPRPSMKGGGRPYNMNKILGKGYRFRKFNIPTLNEILGGR